MRLIKNISITSLVVLLWSIVGHVNAQETYVKGLVLDYLTKEPLPYANVVFEGSVIGTTADIDGRYELTSSDTTLTTIIVSYLGYDTRKVKITPGINQIATVELKLSEGMLAEIDIVGEDKPKKDTAARTLYRNVVKHKKDNAPDEYENYIYENYSKTVFGLYDVKDKFKSRIIVRKVPFLFDNVDTLEENNITILPGLLKENYKHVLYRKAPKKKKEILIGAKLSAIDNESIADLVDLNYEDVEIYKNIINVNGRPVPSPFSDNALLNYTYFLTDTQNIDGYHCYKLEFTGKSIKDGVFSGYAWIHDTTFAIKYIELSLLPQANVNFISLFNVKQGFTKVDGKDWFKNYEFFQTNFSLFKNEGRQNFMAKSESWRRNIIINHQAIDTLVAGEPRVVIKGAREQKEDFWKLVRPIPLTAQEANVDSTAIEVMDAKVVKFVLWFSDALRLRYFSIGPVEIGQFDQFYSFNQYEGNRVKFGLRTAELFDKVLLGGHVAYGFKDEKWKYGAYTRIHLNRPNEMWHMLGGGYKFDYSFVEQRETNDVHDNLLNAILRTDLIDNIFLAKEGNAFYERDWRQGITTRLDFKHKTFQSVPGIFDFNIENTPNPEDGFTTTSLKASFTFAKGIKYLESTSSFERSKVTFSLKPQIDFNYEVGINNFLGSDFGYHKLGLWLSQKLPSSFGYTKYELYAGKTFGRVPYPLLEIHRGNESFYFEYLAFNLLNDFEYVSDAYATLWLEHHFDGFIFNKIPGINFLQLRSIIYARALVGYLNQDNSEVVPLYQELNALNGFYMEMGFGFENIFKLFRVDAMWRITQRDRPGVQKWGIRFIISPQF